MFSYYKDFKIEVSEDVYEPLEDTILFAEFLEKRLAEKKYKTVLEIGCGSGLLSIIAAKSAKVTSVDINPKAVEMTKKNAKLNNVNLECFVSDLFENVESRFDLIIFNSPYLPDKDNVKGNEMWSDNGVISRFIHDCEKFLNDGGEVLLLISSLTGLERIKNEFKNNKFGVKVVERKKIAWEELIILEAKTL
jgi:release factor glutamine methyltransferase